MIKHIVFWKIQNDNQKKNNMLKMKQILEALVGVVPGLLKAEVGFNFNPNGFDVSLYSELESKKALDTYQNHPAHLKVKEFVHNVTIDRAVCDYEIN